MRVFIQKIQEAQTESIIMAAIYLVVIVFASRWLFGVLIAKVPPGLGRRERDWAMRLEAKDPTNTDDR